MRDAKSAKPLEIFLCKDVLRKSEQFLTSEASRDFQAQAVCVQLSRIRSPQIQQRFADEFKQAAAQVLRRQNCSVKAPAAAQRILWQQICPEH